MDENDFKTRLIEWLINPKDSFIPTTPVIKLYGEPGKIKIIKHEHEHLIYENIKPMEMSDELYTKLKERMGMNDSDVLKFIQGTYKQYLKGIRKQISDMQKGWSKIWAHQRANIVMNKLNYTDVYQICDLCNDRRIPIEIILKVVFNKNSKYGDYRRIKQKSEIYVDPRILKAIADKKKREEYKEKFKTTPINKIILPDRFHKQDQDNLEKVQNM